jgi:hypothetical protein
MAVACTTKNETSDLFSKGKEMGIVGKKLDEVSGLAASVTNPGYFWTHNDSGNPAEVYLISSTAEIVMTCKLPNIHNRDWEDITIGPGPIENKSYLYVGDIGDNLAQFAYKIIYRFEEPVLSEGKQEIDEFDTLVFQLSDGVRDTEALMLDPTSKELFIFSKREDSVRLYQIPFQFNSGDTVVAERKNILPLTRIVAADISADGTEILIKNYDYIYYWKRADNQSIPELFQNNPIQLSYNREPQGESIAWQLDGAGFYTLSEAAKHYRGRLLFYKRK